MIQKSHKAAVNGCAWLVKALAFILFALQYKFFGGAEKRAQTRGIAGAGFTDRPIQAKA